MTTNYSIDSKTLVAVARLRELHVARAQAAELKESGRVLTKADSAETAAIQFRNGSVVNVVLPASKIAKWAQLLPGGQARIAIEPGSVTLSNGGSQARFLTAEPTAQNGDPIPVDAGAGREFKLVGPTANETELAEIKRTLAVVRKTAKQANELRLAQKNYRSAFGNLRLAANRVTEARQYIAANSLADAVAAAKDLRGAKRLARLWTTTLRRYNPETPAGLPLTAEDQSWLAKWAKEYAVADKKGWHVKRFKIAMLATNLLVDAVGRLVAERFPIVADSLHLTHVREKFPNISAGVGIYNYDLQPYSTHRRQLRQWNSVRSELAVTYKLAAARLNKAQGKDS